MDEVEALRRLRGRTIALDYDVPVHSYISGWTGPEPTDPPTRGALEFVERLLDAGVIVVIHTCRADRRRGAGQVVRVLDLAGWPHEIVDGTPVCCYQPMVRDGDEYACGDAQATFRQEGIALDDVDEARLDEDLRERYRHWLARRIPLDRLRNAS